jgi:hypothetical protein
MKQSITTDAIKPYKKTVFSVELGATAIKPEFGEVVTNTIVKWGMRNDSPDYLLSLLQKSGKHSAIINRKAAMVAGGGIEEPQTPAFKAFADNTLNEDTLEDIITKVAFDLEIFGHYAIEVVFNGLGNIAELNHLPAEKIRVSQDGQFVYYHSDWTKTKNGVDTPIKLPVLDFANPTGKHVLYVRQYTPGMGFYGQPSYLSGSNWIELEWETSQYHLQQVRNGFHPAVILTFPNSANLSEEEMEEHQRALEREFSGSINSGKTMFMFADTPPTATAFEENNSHERFIQLQNDITQGILVAHQITNPILFGISTPGQLGNSKEVLESQALFQSVYIAPRQKLIERSINRLLAYNYQNSGNDAAEFVVIKPYKIDFSTIQTEVL